MLQEVGKSALSKNIGIAQTARQYGAENAEVHNVHDGLAHGYCEQCTVCVHGDQRSD